MKVINRKTRGTRISREEISKIFESIDQATGAHGSKYKHRLPISPSPSMLLRSPLSEIRTCFDYYRYLYYFDLSISKLVRLKFVLSFRLLHSFSKL